MLLSNILKNGESLAFQWFSPGKGTHALSLSLRYPRILASPWGVSLALATTLETALGQSARVEASVLYALSPELSLSMGLHYAKTTAPRGLSGGNPASMSHYLAILEAGYSDATPRFPQPMGLTASCTLRAGAARMAHRANLPRLDLEVECAYAAPLAQSNFLIALESSLQLRTLLRHSDSLPMMERYSPALFSPYLGFLPLQFFTRALGAFAPSLHWRVAPPIALFVKAQYSIIESEWRPHHLLGYGLGLSLSALSARLSLTLARGEHFSAMHHLSNPWLLHLQLAYLF